MRFDARAGDDEAGGRDDDLDPLTGLALAAKEGDRSALEALCQAVQQPMYRLALRFSGSPADAEDAAQEVMIRLVTNLGSFEGRSRRHDRNVPPR